MNYSDYDSDGYSSKDDEDYVPSDDNLSEDDINECEKEDPLHEEDTVPHSDAISKKEKRKKGRTKKDISVRKRKEGVLKVDNKGRDDTEEQKAQEETEKPTAVEDEDNETKRKKSDALWASFLCDVGSRPKDSAPQSDATQKANSTGCQTSPVITETKPSAPAKVTITKVFDFAGEEVRVNKEVSADSREAKSYLKSQNIQEDVNSDQEKSLSPCHPPLPGPSAKRPAGMSSILSRIGGKKQKMSTLEKSKMDWDAFKSEEGITEELAIHNRGREGYVERKNFLERVDHRQFELEKAVRLSNMKR